MAKPMTVPEFRELLIHINRDHSPNKGAVDENARTVKYVDPHIDMRTGHVFALTFRGYSWTKVLHTQNECRDLPDTLYDRCMNFLDGEGDTDQAGSKDPVLSRDKLFAIVLGEFGRQCAETGKEFGTEELVFRVPLSLVLESIEENKDETSE